MRGPRFWLSENYFIDTENICIQFEKINDDGKVDFVKEPIVQPITDKSYIALKLILENWPEPVHRYRMAVDTHLDTLGGTRENALKAAEEKNDKYFEKLFPAKGTDKVYDTLKKMNGKIYNFAGKHGRNLYPVEKDIGPPFGVKNREYYELRSIYKNPWKKSNERSADILTPGPASAGTSASQLRPVHFSPEPGYIKGSRDNFFNEMDDAFSKAYADDSKPNTVIVHGLGGIGKSIRVKNWAYSKLNSSDYIKFKKVIYARFERPSPVDFLSHEEKFREKLKRDKAFRQLILNDNIFSIPVHRSMDDSNDSVFHKKLNAIIKSEDRETLIILDNFDYNIPDIKDLLDNKFGAFDFSLILISRTKHSRPGINNVLLEEIKNENHLTELFIQNVPDSYEHKSAVRKMGNREIIKNICKLVCGHTLAIELLAKNLSGSAESLSEYYDSLVSRPDSIFSKMQVALQAGEWGESMPIDIISEIFRIADLKKSIDPDSLREVLVFFYGVPVDGIREDVISPFYKKFSRIVKELIDRGWLKKEYKEVRLHDGKTVEKCAYISMHPVVREVIYFEYRDRATNKLMIESCSNIADAIIRYDKEYINGIYHKDVEYKHQISALFESLTRFFPYSVNENFSKRFDFYSKLLNDLIYCERWAVSEALLTEMSEAATDKWEKGFLYYLSGKINILYRQDVPEGENKYNDALIHMKDTSDTKEKKLQLAFLHRDIATMKSSSLKPGIEQAEKDIILAAVDENIDAGESIIKQLTESGYRNTNTDLYTGTLHLRRAQAEIYRTNGDEGGESLARATAYTEQAERIFKANNYINCVDEAAVHEMKALIWRIRGHHHTEAALLSQAQEIYEKHFDLSYKNITRYSAIYTAFSNCGEWTEARKAAEKCLNVIKTVYGELSEDFFDDPATNRKNYSDEHIRAYEGCQEKLYRGTVQVIFKSGRKEIKQYKEGNKEVVAILLERAKKRIDTADLYEEFLESILLEELDKILKKAKAD